MGKGSQWRRGTNFRNFWNSNYWSRFRRCRICDSLMQYDTTNSGIDGAIVKVWRCRTCGNQEKGLRNYKG